MNIKTFRLSLKNDIMLQVFLSNLSNLNLRINVKLKIDSLTIQYENGK